MFSSINFEAILYRILNTIIVPTANTASRIIAFVLSIVNENSQPKKVNAIVMPAILTNSIAPLNALSGSESLITSNRQVNAVT